MNVAYLAFGVVLLVAAVVDLLWTTLWVDGGSGPISARLTTWTWQAIRSVGSERSRLLGVAGPLILMVTLATWVALLWAGWTFVFAGGEHALVDVRDPEPVTWTGRVYFVAYAMFTMGNGDFSPADGAWQIVSALTTASGMLFVTLAVSYVVSILGAVSRKRAFASGVLGLGRRSESFVRTGWNGEDFSGLELPLDSFASELDLLAEQHKAYPILHYYHSEKPEDASALAVAVLDEALILLRFGVPEAHRPDPAIIENARSSTRNYLETLDAAFIRSADLSPPPPELRRLREADVPTATDEAFADALSDLDESRRALLGVVEADAWDWPPVEE